VPHAARVTVRGRIIAAMALPPIKHATTSDGVGIAFHTLGNGPPVVMLFPYHVNHLALNWQVSLHRGAIQFFARYFTVVNLDFRGAGLSERRISALSLEALAEDLDSVLAVFASRSRRVVRYRPRGGGRLSCRRAVAGSSDQPGLHRRRGHRMQTVVC
jgi:hypothetical protein